MFQDRRQIETTIETTLDFGKITMCVFGKCEGMIDARVGGFQIAKEGIGGTELPQLDAAVRATARAGAGEIYLTSIDRDGTGMGYDLAALQTAFKSCDLPIMASGGDDMSDRLAEGIRSGFAFALSTAHLFNFMGDGLRDAREELNADGIPLSHWNFEDLKSC
jgi:cyclase